MKKSAKSRLVSEKISSRNKLYSIPKDNEIAKAPLNHEIQHFYPEKTKKPEAFYDRAIKYGASWSFVILCAILLAAFIIFSVSSYLSI